MKIEHLTSVIYNGKRLSDILPDEGWYMEDNLQLSRKYLKKLIDDDKQLEELLTVMGRLRRAIYSLSEDSIFEVPR